MLAPVQRIAVLVSGGGTNLQALLDAQMQGEIPDGRVVLVVSSVPGAQALNRAAQYGIPARALARKGYSSQEAYDRALISLLEESGIDIVVLAGFLCILGNAFIARYPKRILNVHPSLIPSFCGKGCYGLKVHRQALDYGVKVTGATVHFVNEVPDGGEIIMQKAVDVLPGDTPEILQQRVMRQAEWVLLPQAVQMVCAQLRAAGIQTAGGMTCKA